MSHNAPTLPILPLDEAGLRRTLTTQFAHVFGTGPQRVPPELILRSGMGVGVLVHSARTGTHLSQADQIYTTQALVHMRRVGVPILFDGDFTAINIQYGDDFLDFATGAQKAQVDLFMINYLPNPSIEKRHFAHPLGEGYQTALMHAEDDVEAFENLRHIAMSPHIPFDSPVGRLYANGANAIGAQAIVVFGRNSDTVDAHDFAYAPYVFVGRIIHKGDLGHPCRAQYGSLLLHQDYLTALQKLYAQQNHPHQLYVQTIPRPMDETLKKAMTP